MRPIHLFDKFNRSSILQLVMDRFRDFLHFPRGERKTGFVIDENTLTEATRSLIEESKFDGSLRGRLLSLAGLPLNFKGAFYVSESDLYDEGGVRLVLRDNSSSRDAFTLGFGQDKVTFFNKLALNRESKWIYKMKPKIEIRSLDELIETVESFVRLEPTNEEIIDVGKKDLKKK